MSYEPVSYESLPRYLARTSIIWIFFAALAVALLGIALSLAGFPSHAQSCPPGTVAQTSGGVLNANADSEMTACVKR